jgi:ParB-like chromosome segregation protein Spo0J
MVRSKKSDSQVKVNSLRPRQPAEEDIDAYGDIEDTIESAQQPAQRQGSEALNDGDLNSQEYESVSNGGRPRKKKAAKKSTPKVVKKIATHGRYQESARSVNPAAGVKKHSSLEMQVERLIAVLSTVANDGKKASLPETDEEDPLVGLILQKLKITEVPFPIDFTEVSYVVVRSIHRARGDPEGPSISIWRSRAISPGVPRRPGDAV